MRKSAFLEQMVQRISLISIKITEIKWVNENIKSGDKRLKNTKCLKHTIFDSLHLWTQYTFRLNLLLDSVNFYRYSVFFRAQSIFGLSPLSNSVHF